jgi:hypothetical protein
MKDYLNNLNMKLADISRTNKWNNSRIKLMTLKKQLRTRIYETYILDKYI